MSVLLLTHSACLQHDPGAYHPECPDRLRAITIKANLTPGYSMGEAIDFFRSVVSEELPPSAKLDFDGESREYLQSSQALYWTFLGALLVVFLVLAAQFESFTLPLIIMTTVPLAIVPRICLIWESVISTRAPMRAIMRLVRSKYSSSLPRRTGG